MAGAKEIGIGMASVLATDGAPEPLPLSFRGQTLEEAGRIVLAILAECRDADVSIQLIEGDPELCRLMAKSVHVPLSPKTDLSGEIRFYRKPRS